MALRESPTPGETLGDGKDDATVSVVVRVGFVLSHDGETGRGRW